MRFVDGHRGRCAVALLLRVLNIAASTYYGRRDRTVRPCGRAEVDRALLSDTHEIWVVSGHTCGADRVRRRLGRDGIGVGRRRVERLMAG
ncbi:IS3 family transposase [Micromonospora sp. LOL_023]|uniref:IS3 family transposase n=1 Tax=Micromonospora sp. LOL_023 TaxID=3345418 RepID=UPI003A872296